MKKYSWRNAGFGVLLALLTQQGAAQVRGVADQHRGAKPHHFREVKGQAGYEEFLTLAIQFSRTGKMNRLPIALRRAFRVGQLRIGSIFGPDGAWNDGGYYSFDFFTGTPPGIIKGWTVDGNKRSFHMYWIPNAEGAFGGMRVGDPGTAAYFEADLPIPLRRSVIVLAQYQGLRSFKNQYDEESKLPFLKIVAAAATNGSFYVNKEWKEVEDQVVFLFDDELLTEAKSKLTPEALAPVELPQVEKSPK